MQGSDAIEQGERIFIYFQVLLVRLVSASFEAPGLDARFGGRVLFEQIECMMFPTRR
jgi:hypothetical protein